MSPALPLDEFLDQAEVAAGGGGVERRPELAVPRVDVGAGVQQRRHHVPEVVDAALGWGGTESGGGGACQKSPRDGFGHRGGVTACPPCVTAM